MLTFAALLTGIWFLALLTAYTFGGMIHVILVAAVVLALVRIIEGPRVA